jgi:hypothetical protein
MLYFYSVFVFDTFGETNYLGPTLTLNFIPVGALMLYALSFRLPRAWARRAAAAADAVLPDTAARLAAGGRTRGAGSEVAERYDTTFLQRRGGRGDDGKEFSKSEYNANTSTCETSRRSNARSGRLSFGFSNNGSEANVSEVVSGIFPSRDSFTAGDIEISRRQQSQA